MSRPPSRDEMCSSVCGSRSNRPSLLARCGAVILVCVLSRFVAAEPPPCGDDLYECALNFVNQRNLPGAAAILYGELKKEPRNIRSQNLLGIILLETGKTREAESQFRQALALQPKFYPARKNLAVAEFTLGEFDKAKSNFEEVLVEKPGDPVSLLYIGEFAYRRGDCAQALSAFEASGASVASVPPFAVHDADCLIRSGRAGDALQPLQRLPPNAADVQFAAGMLLAKARQYPQAAEFFHRARQGSVDAYAAGYNQALTELQGGLYQAAVDTVGELLRSDQTKSELLNLQAAAYRKLDRVRDAYDALRKAAQLSPTEEQNYIDLADMCLDYNNYDLGFEIINLGLKSIPDSERLYLHRGVMNAMRGKLSEAEADFQFVADLDPKSALPQAALSLTWMAMGDAPKAIRTLRERDKENRTNFAISFLLGQALTRQGTQTGSSEEAEAIAAFDKAIRLNPQYAPARAELGKLLLRRGDQVRGIDELEKTIKLDPNDRTAAYQLAQAYRKKGEQQKASEMIAHVTKLNAQDRDQDLKRAMVLIVRQTGGTGAASPKLASPEAQTR